MPTSEETLAQDTETPEVEVDIADILRTIGDALTELFQRVELLEKRPQFASSIRTRKTGH